MSLFRVEMRAGRILGVVLLAGLVGGVSPSAAAQGAQETGTIRGVVRDPLLRRNAAVIYVEKIPGKTFEPPTEPVVSVVMDQKDLRFVPHVLPTVVGTTVAFPNNDDVRHSVFATPKSATKFNLGTYDVGVVKRVLFDRPGVTTLLCNVHAEMAAYIVVLETPYFALTDRRGAFTIEGIPAGTYELSIWQERLRPKTETVTVTAGKVVEIEFADLQIN